MKEKRKRKIEQKDLRHLSKNTLLKKKQLHSIRFSWRMLGFDWSCWLSDAPVGFRLELWVRKWDRDTNEKEEKGERRWEWLRWID